MCSDRARTCVGVTAAVQEGMASGFISSPSFKNKCHCSRPRRHFAPSQTEVLLYAHAGAPVGGGDRRSRRGRTDGIDPQSWKYFGSRLYPPQTIIWLPVQTAGRSERKRAAGAPVAVIAVHGIGRRVIKRAVLAQSTPTLGAPDNSSLAAPRPDAVGIGGVGAALVGTAVSPGELEAGCCSVRRR